MGDESLRETIEAVYNESKGAGDAEAGTGGASTGVSEAVSADKASTVQPKLETSGPARVRDESGKFAKADKAEAPAKAVTTSTKAPEAKATTATDTPKDATATSTEAPKAAESTSTAPIKAPQSWKPAAREKWAALPPEVQQEVSRREREVQIGLQKAAEHEKSASAFREAVAPYEQQLKAQGLDPVKATAGLLQLWGNLETQPIQGKAMLLRQVAQRFGIPAEAMREAFQAPSQNQAPALQPQPDVRELINQTIQERLQAAETERANAAIESARERHEFFDDVGVDAICELAGSLQRAGKVKNGDFDAAIDKAYSILAASDSDISKILEQRKAAQSVATSHEATQRSRAAASSVRASHPAPSASSSNKSTRDTVADVYRELSGK